MEFDGIIFSNFLSCLGGEKWFEICDLVDILAGSMELIDKQNSSFNSSLIFAGVSGATETGVGVFRDISGSVTEVLDKEDLDTGLSFCIFSINLIKALFPLKLYGSNLEPIIICSSAESLSKIGPRGLYSFKNLEFWYKIDPFKWLIKTQKLWETNLTMYIIFFKGIDISGAFHLAWVGLL